MCFVVFLFSMHFCMSEPFHKYKKNNCVIQLNYLFNSENGKGTKDSSVTAKSCEQGSNLCI